VHLHLHRLGIQAFNPILSKVMLSKFTHLFVLDSTPTSTVTKWRFMFHFLMQHKLKLVIMMAANKNLLKPQNGEPIVQNQNMDMVLGCYWMTKSVDGEKGEGMIFMQAQTMQLQHLILGNYFPCKN
jgi:DNA-directed RNA polymerase subunit beta'